MGFNILACLHSLFYRLRRARERKRGAEESKGRKFKKGKKLMERVMQMAR